MLFLQLMSHVFPIRGIVLKGNINDKLFIQEWDTGNRSRASTVIQIHPGNYNEDLLETTLQSKNPAVAFGSFSGNYNPTTFSFTILVAGNALCILCVI